jgi:hypothetical protein
MENIISNILAICQSEDTWVVVFGLLTILTHIAAITPVAYDNKVLNYIRMVLDLIAGNYGVAKNAKSKVENAEKTIEDEAGGK